MRGAAIVALVSSSACLPPRGDGVFTPPADVGEALPDRPDVGPMIVEDAALPDALEPFDAGPGLPAFPYPPRQFTADSPTALPLLVITGTCSFATATRTFTGCGADLVTEIENGAAVVHAGALQIGRDGVLEIQGSLPAAFLVYGDVRIAGQIVAVGVDAPSPAPDCAEEGGSSENFGGAGGAGGTFATIGGTGGDAEEARGGRPLTPELAPPGLRTGCTGGRGGYGDDEVDNRAPGGHPGGGIQISAAGTLEIEPEAIVDASGGGGLGGLLFGAGGGGGGSGGMIVLEAATLIASGSVLVAGGGGGGGATFAVPGVPGCEGWSVLVASPPCGGALMISGGWGDEGRSGSGPGVRSMDDDGAGGGGGGAGWIVRNATRCTNSGLFFGVIAPGGC